MQKFENMLWLGKCPFGEMSSRGSILWGSVGSGNCPFGEMFVGEVSVGDLSSGKCQSGKCPVGKLSYNRPIINSFTSLSPISIGKIKTTFLFISSTICNPVGPCLPYLTLLLTIMLNKVNGVLLGCIIVEEIKKSWLSR